MIGHHDVLERGGQGINDPEKVLKLLDSMTTSNVANQTCMELVCQGVSFQDVTTSLSTSIGTIFSLVNVKGRKALDSKTGTGNGDGKKSNSSHMNGILFTTKNWKNKFSNDDCNCFPTQLKRLIGFAKEHNYDEKHVAFVSSKDPKKGGRQTSEMS